MEYPRRNAYLGCLVMTGVPGAARIVGLADEANDLDEAGALSEAAKRRINPMVIVREKLDVDTNQSSSSLSLSLSQPIKDFQLCDIPSICKNSC